MDRRNGVSTPVDRALFVFVSDFFGLGSAPAVRRGGEGGGRAPYPRLHRRPPAAPPRPEVEALGAWGPRPEAAPAARGPGPTPAKEGGEVSSSRPKEGSPLGPEAPTEVGRRRRTSGPLGAPRTARLLGPRPRLGRWTLDTGPSRRPAR